MTYICPLDGALLKLIQIGKVRDGCFSSWGNAQCHSPEAHLITLPNNAVQPGKWLTFTFMSNIFKKIVWS